MIFSDLYGRYLDVELGSADRTSLFTTARRQDAVNRAQQEFAKQTECFTKSVSIALSNGTREYDLETLITADDFVLIAQDGAEYVFTDASGNVTYRSGDDFPRLDLDVLNREQAGWRLTSGASFPQSYYLREEGGTVFLGFSEPPLIGAGESASMTLPYLATPPDMNADTDEPFSDSAGTNPKRSLRPWHQALVHYAAALLEPLRKNYAGEQRQRGLFAAIIADYLQRHGKKGGSRVTFAHDYRAAARGRGLVSRARLDWRVWP